MTMQNYPPDATLMLTDARGSIDTATGLPVQVGLPGSATLRTLENALSPWSGLRCRRVSATFACSALP